MKRVLTLVAAIVLALLITSFVSEGIPTGHPADTPQESLGSFAGASPAQAEWYFTCSTNRHKHRHFGAGKTHIWKDIIVIRRSGNKYVRGTWVTFDWSRERVTNSDRKTYGPC
jgi:hypothetical protein